MFGIWYLLVVEFFELFNVIKLSTAWFFNIFFGFLQMLYLRNVPYLSSGYGYKCRLSSPRLGNCSFWTVNFPKWLVNFGNIFVVSNVLANEKFSIVCFRWIRVICNSENWNWTQIIRDNLQVLSHNTFVCFRFLWDKFLINTVSLCHVFINSKKLYLKRP